MFARAFVIAYRSILRNWRQSFTALISISTSYVSLTLFQGYMDDVKKMYEDSNIEREMMGHVIIERIDGKNIKVADQVLIDEFLHQQSEVKASVRFLPVSGTITNGRTSMVFVGLGTDVSQGQKMRGKSWEWNALAGRPLDPNTDGLMIGHKLSRILGCNPDPIADFKQGLGGFTAVERPLNCPQKDLQLNVVTIHGQMNSMTLPLTGITDAIYKELDERFISIPLPLAQNLLDTDEVKYFAIKLDSMNSSSVFIKKINPLIQSKGLHAVDWHHHPLGDLFNRTMDLLTLFRNFVVTVILVISSLSVFNTLLRNISERSREIGTLRSLGFTPFKIRTFFGAEALLLSLMGCVTGALCGTFLEWTINLLGLTYKPGVFSSPVPFTIGVGQELMGQTALFLIFLVLLTSQASLQGALKRTISDSLGYV